MPRKVSPTIALCVVARKDEEHLIDECLASARPFVDEVVVEFSSVDDVAAARNAAVSAARADWVLMLDAGERLDPASGPDLRRLARRLPAGAHGYSFRLRRGRDVPIDELAARFFLRRLGLVWRGEVHEELVCEQAPESTVFVDAESDGVIHRVVARPLKEAHGLIEQALARDPDDVRLRYYLGESHLRDGQPREAAACFKTCLLTPDRLPRPLLVDAFATWLEALITLGDVRNIERVARRGEAAQALSPAAREMLADYNERRGRLTEARRQLVLALDPRVSPFGLVRPEGVGGWRTRLHLALVDEQLGLVEQALQDLSRATDELPDEHQFNVAVLGARIAARRGARVARPWFERAAACAPDSLDAHAALLELRLAIPELIDTTTDDSFSALDRDLANQEWQAAYDAAMRLPLEDLAALARVLYLAGCLRERGAADAALDLLDRALDAHPRTRPVYWRLTSVLIDLDRYADAQIALEVLQLLGREAAQLPELQSALAA